MSWVPGGGVYITYVTQVTAKLAQNAPYVAFSTYYLSTPLGSCRVFTDTTNHAVPVT